MAKTTTFDAFTKKWKKFVEDQREIKDEDWRQFFAPSNPVAGINFGALTDTYTDNKGRKSETNERKTIKDNWSDISTKFKELYDLQNPEEIKQKLKDINSYILDVIKNNGGKEKKVAINRILATLYPDKLLTIPGEKDVERLADLLGVSTEKENKESKDWIDLCFEIKPILEERYPNMMHWGAYLQLVQENNLTKNYNLILTGAPGTGKTFLARQMAANIIGVDMTNLDNNDQFGFVQFHPSYDYTDFVEGLRPQPDGSFKRQDGVFKSFCAKAAIAEKEDKDKEKDEKNKRKFVFVIDEINRGEISKIFGELFFSIDPGYRKKEDRIPVRTQYQNLIDDDESLTPDNYRFKKGFYVPSNVYVIGTMNDIDRSVESMDFAFRRRFSFYEVKATDTQYSILKDVSSFDEAIKKMNSLNKAIENIEGLSPAYHIGAAYFKKITLYENERESWILLWNNHLKGLLFEYLRGKPNTMDLLKQLESAYFGKDINTEEGQEEGEKAENVNDTKG